jgi:hypothetical protein
MPRADLIGQDRRGIGEAEFRAWGYAQAALAPWWGLVCRATAYKMMKNGMLRTVLIGGRRVIPVDAAEALLQEGA